MNDDSFSCNNALRSCDTPVAERVASIAASLPRSLAVIEHDCQITYGELEKRANQLARYLRSVGVAKEIVVGTCLPRSIDSVVTALAILKAGGAFLPLDPNSPADRLSLILNDSKSPVVVTSGDHATSLRASQRFVIDIQADWDKVEPFSDLPLEMDILPEHLAYVIYTSGSTGTPKGVAVTHRNLCNLVDWHLQAFGVTEADRASMLASPGFDAAVWEVWPYLTVGASLSVCDDQTRTDSEKLRDWMIAQGITIGFVPTPLIESLMLMEWRSNTKLRTVLTGGDPLHSYPPSSLPFTLVNNYGPAECTVVTTSGVVRQAKLSPRMPSIGTAIFNTQVFILDERMRPVSPNVTGEIYIGGAGVARGYLNRPELTSQVFVADSFSKVEGARLYKTGDLGRMSADGQIEFAGRVDEQVKIRGYRVEPGEVVAALKLHPSVRNSAVVPSRISSGDQSLVAYVVLQPAATLTKSEVQAFLRSHVPSYMVPSSFVVLDSIPSTANGKVDRSCLPLPSADNTLPDHTYVPPSTIVEERVAAIVSALLGLDRVSATDNFFYLGGHSLLGTQLISRVRDGFGIELPLLSIFQKPTITAISAEIEQLILAKIHIPPEVQEPLAS